MLTIFFLMIYCVVGVVAAHVVLTALLSFTTQLDDIVDKAFTFFPLMLIHGSNKLAASLIDWLQVCLQHSLFPQKFVLPTLHSALTLYYVVTWKSSVSLKVSQRVWLDIDTMCPCLLIVLALGICSEVLSITVQCSVGLQCCMGDNYAINSRWKFSGGLLAGSTILELLFVSFFFFTWNYLWRTSMTITQFFLR